jgi:hypothetical protein
LGQIDCGVSWNLLFERTDDNGDYTRRRREREMRDLIEALRAVAPETAASNTLVDNSGRKSALLV